MSSVPVPDMVEPPVNVIAVPFLSKDPIRPPFSTMTVFPLTVIPVEPYPSRPPPLRRVTEQDEPK